MRVQPFKVGPDYLYTGWHVPLICAWRPAPHSFMLPPPVLNALFCEQMRQADIAVIEGVMGCMTVMASTPLPQHSRDGQTAAARSSYWRTAGMFQHVAATVMGISTDPTLNLAGVIVNRVTSDAHYQLPQNAIEHWLSPPVLGMSSSLRRRRIT